MGKRRKNVSEAERKRIEELLKAGRAPTAVTREVGRSPSAVYKIQREIKARESKAEPGSAVYEKARLRHVERLEKVGRDLLEQVHLPEPPDAGSWVPPQGARYGVSALLTGSRRELVHPPFTWKRNEKGAAVIQLAAETDGLYFPCLRDHLPDKNLWDSFENWKKAGAGYLAACNQLVQDIVGECERRTGSTILISQEWPQEGVFWNFVAQVYVQCTFLAQGYTAPSESGYEFREGPSRVKGQGKVYQLWHEAYGIACHRDRSGLERWRGIHEALLGGDDFKARGRDLVTQHRALEEPAAPIQKVLRYEIERATFDRGRCQLCPRRAS